MTSDPTTRGGAGGTPALPVMSARCAQTGFSLIELLVSISIIAVLASMVAPQLQKFRERAETTKCSGNLRAIGVAANLAAQDNGNIFPLIETRPSDPVYVDEEEPVGTMMEVLGPYGLSDQALKCPTDTRRKNFFATEGTSYIWSPVSGDEPLTAVKVYGRRGIRVRELSRVMLCSDFEGIHQGHINRLYADGSVRIRR